VRLNSELAQRTKRFKSNELVELLNKAGVPSGPIYSIDQMWADPQVQHVGMAVPMAHPAKTDVSIVNQAVALSRTPSVINRPTPKLGEHNDEVLSELGYDKEAVADMKRRKVI
jgi:crotonobetainyl-CoA:carnitine CoA-transferase CaiB-like acyl-CoA transferase